MSGEGKPLIVSLTPTAAIHDTRTMKIACALRDLGWRSMIIQNKPGETPQTLSGIEVKTLFGIRRPNKTGSVGKSASPRSDGSVILSGVSERLHYLRFLFIYFGIRPLQAVWHLRRANAIYLHEYRLYPAIAFTRWLGVRVPFIYDAHDFYPDVYRNDKLSTFWRRRFLPMLMRLERSCIFNADAVVVVTEGIADLYQENYGVAPIVVRNAYDKRLEEPVDRDIRQILGLNESDFLFVCIGNRKPGMAIENVVNAMSRLPQHVHLAIVGDFHQPTAEYARSLQLDDRVHVLGRMPSGQIVPLVRSANAAVVPYFPETSSVRSILPNGFFQSIAAGLLLVYPPLEDIRRVIGDKQVGVEADAEDIEALVRAMRTLACDAVRREEYISTVAQLADTVSWDFEKKKIAHLVEDMLT